MPHELCVDPIFKRNQQNMAETSANHTNELLSHICELYNNKNNCDIVIKVGDRRYYLHKIILSHSSVLKVMLGTKNSWNESQQKEISLHESDACMEHIDTFFKYFYTGIVELSAENVIPILLLANKYDMPLLEFTCEEYASQIVFSGFSPEFVLEIWLLADQLQTSFLQQKCKEFISLNFSDIVNSDSFLELPLEKLQDILSENDLVISSEYGLFKAVEKWLSHHERKNDYIQNFRKLLPYLKFCTMSPEELMSVEGNLRKFAVFDAVSESEFQQKLMGAYKYHAIALKSRASHFQETEFEVVPRLYTDMDNKCAHCAVIFIESNQNDSSTDPISIEGVLKFPVSFSKADAGNKRSLQYKLKQKSDFIKLTMWTVFKPEVERVTFEPSILLHKQVNGRQFVKGAAQFRCVAQTVHTEACTHVFTVKLPLEALDSGSSYQLQYNGKRGCIFTLVMRQLHIKQ